ncbi:hypothetical protein BDN67DRAFT_1013707 [Paxillus ammoniavirescens]|nr:hypothetical protein BDN67DRAFT_1013707 [Paxillus ammoniavirescens]
MVQAQLMTVTDSDEDGQRATNDTDDSPRIPPQTPPQPPPIPTPPPLPDYPEQRDDDNAVKSNTTAAQRRADAMDDQGGQTDSPGSPPLSVRLEGERDHEASRYVEADHVETNSDHVEEDHDNQTRPRNPVGTTDGDEHHPSEPTEPPDENEGERRGNGKGDVESRVEMVKTVETVETVEAVKTKELR